MTTRDLDRIKQIYLDALDLDPGERSAFVELACEGDLAMLAQVESLIDAQAKADRLFEKPAWESLVPSTPRDEKDGGDVPARDSDLPFERIGDFRMIKRLGGGGMGVVYLAEQESLGRHAALKMIHPDRLGSFEAAKRFWREVDAVSRLSHPNIVTVYESGEEKGVRYYAMELVPGNDLDQELSEASERLEKVATSKILVWIRDIARALDCAHKVGIIHRDVKPSNIRIAPEGRAMLMDFGVARHMKLSTMTLTGEFRGTPHYASPEQVQARSIEIDARSDIYSLGVVLYEAVTGRVPFMGETTEQVFRQILHRDPLPPRRLNPAIARDVETVIVKAMEKDPAGRYQTMAAFADDIDRILAGEMILAKPAGFATRCWKRIKRNPVVSVAIVVALLSVTALVLSVPWYVMRINSEKAEALEEAKRKQALYNLSYKFLSERLKLPVYRKSNPKEIADGLAADVKAAFRGEEDSEHHAWFLEVSALYYRSHRYYEESTAQFRKALAIRTRLQGPEHPDTLDTLERLATGLCRSSAKFAESEELYRRVLTLRQTDPGPDDPKTLATMDQLLWVLMHRKHYSEAEQLCAQMIEIRRRYLGNDAPETVSSLVLRAESLIGQKRYNEAEVLLLQVYHFYRRVFRIEDSRRRNARVRLVDLYTAWGRPNRAAHYLAESDTAIQKTDRSLIAKGSTRSDGVDDLGSIDLGYHYPRPLNGLSEDSGEPSEGGRTIFVPDDYVTIQQGIDAAIDNDTIVVRDGKYEENIDFKRKAITLRSESGPAHTIIDGTQSGSTVRFVSGEGPDSRIEGFTITNGSGTSSKHNFGYSYGGGVFCFNSSPTIRHNVISRNVATATGNGGGISCRSSSPLIEKNEIIHNAATWGGGIHLDSSFAEINNNTVSRNVSIQGFAGGISCYYSSPMISNNVVTHNKTDLIGGGIYMHDSSPTILNNLVCFNEAAGGGGGFHFYFNSCPLVINNTIVGNRAGNRGGGISGVAAPSFSILTNSIVWGNQAPSDPEIYAKPDCLRTICCNIQGGWTGEGNIDTDPLFVESENGDFHLEQAPCQPGVVNPCVDAGGRDF